MTERAAFGLELQRLRERRGLSLDQLAEVTKISGSLFAGLERGDLSRWPSGIFRRAFVRSYAQAVGLDCEETVARFVRLFPEADAESAEGRGPATPETDPVEQPRLVLDEGKNAPTLARSATRRLSAAAVDLAIAAVPGAAAGALFGWQWFWIVAAAIGALGHLVAISLVGATPGAFLFLKRRPSVALSPEASEVVRHRPEAEPQVSASRRRVPRHAAGTRPVTSRARHAPH